ncbi:MAG: flagellar assembly protein FliW [Candidatus Xenobiia bacterium LiM19]
MEFETTRFGTMTVDENKIITLPEGLVGFEKFHRYIIITIEQFKPFLWLQSLELGSLSFLLTDPWLFFTDYAPELQDSDVSFLKIDDVAAVATYCLIAFNNDWKSTKFNLLAPLCINHARNIGRQVILNNSGYSVSTSLKSFSMNSSPQSTLVHSHSVEGTLASAS